MTRPDTDLATAIDRQANKPFKGKGMQLGGKGAKNKADLLDALGGAPVPEEATPLMVSCSHKTLLKWS